MTRGSPYSTHMGTRAGKLDHLSTTTIIYESMQMGQPFMQRKRNWYSCSHSLSRRTVSFRTSQFFGRTITAPSPCTERPCGCMRTPSDGWQRQEHNTPQPSGHRSSHESMPSETGSTDGDSRPHHRSQIDGRKGNRRGVTTQPRMIPCHPSRSRSSYHRGAW